MFFDYDIVPGKTYYYTIKGFQEIEHYHYPRFSLGTFWSGFNSTEYAVPDAGHLGDGVLAPASYLVAAERAGLIGNDALPLATPFDDGVSNILKYAFNLDLSASDARHMTSDGDSGLPSGELVEVNGEPCWRVQYVRRIGSAIIYTPMKSENLNADSFLPITETPEIQTIDDQWQRVVIEMPYDNAEQGSLFTRVRIEMP